MRLSELSYNDLIVEFRNSVAEAKEGDRTNNREQANKAWYWAWSLKRKLRARYTIPPNLISKAGGY